MAMHASVRDQVQQYSLHKELFTASRAAPAHHVDGEHCIKTHINPHDGFNAAFIIQQ